MLDTATTVRVDADTTGLAGEITSAVDAADTSVTVPVDASGVAPAADAVDRLERETREATSSAGGLRVALGQVAATAGALGLIVGVREFGQFLTSAVGAASSLIETQSKANVVFGDSVAVVNEFAETSTTTVGLAKQEALEFAGTFGNLFTAMELSREQAAGLSLEVVQLGADFASFNDLQVTDALEKLRSGLVGEIEPLRSLGISFNAAQVEAKALELGLVDVNGAVSEGAKVQARWALITEQAANAQGDFARTSESLANQQRSLASEAKNALTTIGNVLLPTVLELAGTAREEILPTFTELAVVLLPLVVRAFDVLAPTLGVTLELMQALTPALNLAVSLLEAIPDPVLQMVATFGAVRGVLGPIPELFEAIALRGLSLQGGLSRVGSALSGLVSPLGLVTAGIAAAVFVISDYNQKKAEQKRRIDEVADALTAENAIVDDVTASIARQRAETGNQVDDLRRLGLSFTDLRDLAEQGDEGLRKFLERLVKSGELRVSTRAYDSTAEAIDALMVELGRGSEGRFRNLVEGNEGLALSFAGLQRELQEGARQAIDTKLATEEITQAQVDYVTAANTAADGTVNWTDALRDLEVATSEAGVAARRLAADRDAVINTSEDLARFERDNAAAVAEHTQALESLDGLFLRFGPRASELVDLFSRGNVSLRDFALAAASYGLTIEELLGVQDAVNEQVGAFTDAVVDGLGGIQDSLGRINEDEGIREFVDRFAQEATDLANFVDNIAKLVARGADDLAAALAQAGPGAAKAAREAADASDKELSKLEERYTLTANHLEAAERRMADTAPLLADNWQRATDRIEGVSPPDLASGIRESLDQAFTVLDIATGPGGSIVVQIRAGGQKAGEEFGAGFVEGIGNLTPEVGQAAAQMGMTAEEYAKSVLGIRSPSSVGRDIGEAFVLGMAEGLRDLDPVVLAAERVAGAITTAATVAPVVPAFAVPAAVSPSAPSAGTAPTATLTRQAPNIQIGPNIETRVDPVQVAAAAEYLFTEHEIAGG